MDQRIREVVRYLGYGAHAVDDKTLEMIRSSLKELDQINRYRVVYLIKGKRSARHIIPFLMQKGVKMSELML